VVDLTTPASPNIICIVLARLRGARPLALCGSALLVVSGLLPPLHLHEDADHDHADHHVVSVIRRHFAPHTAPANSSSSLSDCDGPMLVLDQQAIGPTHTHAAHVRLAILSAVVSLPPVDTPHSIKPPQIDGSPPHGPPTRPASLRAPPFLA
jgi:hypothetical protein